MATLNRGHRSYNLIRHRETFLIKVTAFLCASRLGFKPRDTLSLCTFRVTRRNAFRAVRIMNGAISFVCRCASTRRLRILNAGTKISAIKNAAKTCRSRKNKSKEEITMDNTFFFASEARSGFLCFRKSMAITIFCRACCDKKFFATRIEESIPTARRVILFRLFQLARYIGRIVRKENGASAEHIFRHERIPYIRFTFFVSRLIYTAMDYRIQTCTSMRDRRTRYRRGRGKAVRLMKIFNFVRE